MRALSLGLVKGSLDGVDQIAHLHWVQPRVLDAAQVRMCWFATLLWARHPNHELTVSHLQLIKMRDNLHGWITTVQGAAEHIRTHGAEVLVE